MRNLTFLLRPSWLVLLLIVIGFVYLCFTQLAPWQLGKNAATVDRNRLIEESSRAAPVSLGEISGEDTPSEWTRVVLSGTYVEDADIVVRLRSNSTGKPAYEIVTPFALSDGKYVLVDRGYFASEARQDPDVPPAPTGPVTVLGRIRFAETQSDKAPTNDGRFPQVYSITPRQLGSLYGVDFADFSDVYVQLDQSQPGGLEPAALPQLEQGPYLSYGLQWLAFGVMAPLGLLYFVRAELRERRRPHTAAGQTQSARISNRYGHHDGP